jgi:hypothetical protein
MTAKIVEYHFRCFCGTPIVATEKKATCVACGKTLGIRRVKKHRRKWYTFPRPVRATSGWLWGKGLVESVAERRFRFQCACGSAIVTAEKTTSCTSCGETISILRVCLLFLWQSKCNDRKDVALRRLRRETQDSPGWKARNILEDGSLLSRSRTAQTERRSNPDEFPCSWSFVGAQPVFHLLNSPRYARPGK